MNLTQVPNLALYNFVFFLNLIINLILMFSFFTKKLKLKEIFFLFFFNFICEVILICMIHFLR